MTKRVLLKKGEALMLRTCDADGKSYGGFQWPKKGAASCDDWKPAPSCGNGLHGILWGMGDGSLLNWDAEAKWLVVRVKLAAVVKIDSDKVKVPRGEVVYYGDRLHATELIAKYAPAGSTIVGLTATAGDGGTATAGDGGTATAGDGGTATAGDGGTATAGDGGTATAGDGGTATAGDGGTATAGDGGTATAGDEGTATAGDRGTATAGDGGTATAGDEGTATAGDEGTATAGYRGTATAGDGGTATAGDEGTATAGDGGTATAGDEGTATAGDRGNICIRYWNGERYKLATFAVGENDIKPKTSYRVNEKGEPQEVKAGAQPAPSPQIDADRNKENGHGN